MASRGLTLTDNHGYLSSLTASQLRRGTADCPWIIRAAVGQQINLTVHDFDTAKSKSDICHAYLTIRERQGTHSETVCNTIHRIRHAYLSKSHSVELRMLTSNGWHYIVEYRSK